MQIDEFEEDCKDAGGKLVSKDGKYFCVIEFPGEAEDGSR